MKENGDVKLSNDLDLTIFVPCYNEEQNIIITLETILDAISQTKFKYEIIIVDDCSNDNTAFIVEEFLKKSKHKHIRLIQNEVNRGLGYNYVESAFLGCGKYFIAFFGDNSEPKETMLAIIKNLGVADIVIPYFGENDTRSKLRVYISRLFVGIVNFISGFKLHYYNGPVLHKRYNIMRWHSNTLGFAYQAELITQLLFYGASYVQVPIENRDREDGLTKAFTIKNFLSVAHSLFQILCKRIRQILFKV